MSDILEHERAVNISLQEALKGIKRLPPCSETRKVLFELWSALTDLNALRALDKTKEKEPT